MRDVRDTYIRQVVAGKSFADVGGLWGTVNEKVSVAHTHGARTLSMIDVSPPDSELWSLFEERRRTLRLPAVECVSADILTLAEADPRPQFDVVHCSGVLYHMPEPMQFLRALRRITREALVLTSAITATRVESAKGSLSCLPRPCCVFRLSKAASVRLSRRIGRALSAMGRSASRRRWRSGVLRISAPGGGYRRLRHSEPCVKWPGFVMKPEHRVGTAMRTRCDCPFGRRTQLTSGETPGRPR